jgi:hypothetical protein
MTSHLKHTNVTWTISCLFLLCNVYIQADTTVQVIALLRSGNSFPEVGKVKDLITLDDYSSDKRLYREITGNGLRSAYILGQDLLNRYPFLGTNSKKLSDFTMIASKTNRTLMTAQAVMLGIFGLNNDTRTVDVLDEFQQPPFNGETASTSFATPLPQGVYPVPFESYNKEFNNVLRPWDEYGCKEFSGLTSKYIEGNTSFIDDYDNLVQTLQKNKVSNKFIF